MIQRYSLCIAALCLIYLKFSYFSDSLVGTLNVDVKENWQELLFLTLLWYFHLNLLFLGLEYVFIRTMQGENYGRVENSYRDFSTEPKYPVGAVGISGLSHCIREVKLGYVFDALKLYLIPVIFLFVVLIFATLLMIPITLFLIISEVLSPALRNHLAFIPLAIDFVYNYSEIIIISLYVVLLETFCFQSKPKVIK